MKLQIAVFPNQGRTREQLKDTVAVGQIIEDHEHGQ